MSYPRCLGATVVDKPNIVFIFSDQQRPDTMGYAGDPVAITPHLDRLAAQGTVFSRCTTSSPVCMPARASIMSGKQVHQHGIWAFADPELRHGQSHVRNIRDAGYHTGVVGKTHLWMHGKGHANDHLDEMRDWGFVDPRETTGPSESINTESIYSDHLAEKGLLEVHRAYLDMYLNGQRPLPWELPPTKLPTEDHLDHFIAGLAEDWLSDCPKDTPFYLQVNFGGPHDPWDASPEYRAMYNPDDMPLSIPHQPTGPVSPHVELLLQHAPAKVDRMSEAQNRVMKSYYYAKVTLIDDCVGRVVRALKAHGQLDNTWIVFSSDHGEMLGDHGLLAKKVFYDGAVNVPCLFRPPGGARGKSTESLTCHLDIVATLTDIAGAAPMSESDGRSLLGHVTGDETRPHQTAVLSELGLPPSVFTMVRTDRYKLSIDTSTRAPIDLYDMQEDPDEQHNRVDDPALEHVKEELIETMLDPMLADLDTSQW
jgi:choline-sulfatase